MLVQLADSMIRHPEGIVKNMLVRVKNSFVLANFVVLDMEGDLGIELILGRPFLRDVRARIGVGTREIRFHIGKEDMFFRFKHREEQHFLIYQDSEGQALWGEPPPQPEPQLTTSRRKRRQRKVWRKVESAASSNSPGQAKRWYVTPKKNLARRTLNDASLP